MRETKGERRRRGVGGNGSGKGKRVVSGILGFRGGEEWEVGKG